MMKQGMARSRQQHVVAVPLPTPGHVHPFMRFCKLLVKHHAFTVTFVHFDPIPNAPAEKSPQPQQQVSPSPAATPAAPHPLIRSVHIPIHRLDLSNGFKISIREFYDTLLSVAPDLEELILSLNRDGPPVTCLLSDVTFTFPTQDVADKLGIPRIVLLPSCASRLLFTHYVSQGELITIERVKEALAATRQRQKVFCELPGLPTLCNNDIPHYRHVMDETVAVWTTSTESWKVCNARAHAVVVNSFEGLEASTLATLSKCCNVPIYDVGLWVEPLQELSATSLWAEDKYCLSWLDEQATSSVLYISFGSITLISETQYEEFLNGLLASQQRFLWVLRPGLVENIDYTSCVANIMSKSHGKGLVISWAPQLQVLAHPSVCGFLTHCGWNSISESIANGVPMLCWPYFADQPLNACCIVNEWKVGLRLECCKQDTGLIERCEIEKAIRALMEGPEGRLVSENVTKLKEKNSQCMLENGSSYVNLKALILSL